MGKISIIVPVYNVEKYLKKCIDSILSQTYTNLDIILVNDGSTDNSGMICEDYAKKDKRITVIHKKNGGLSSARNAGLDIAKGEYIGFVDSDDFIADNMYEILYHSIIDYNCDISIARLQSSDSEEKRDFKVRKMNKFEALERTIVPYDLEIGIPTRLYKRFIFDNLRFDVGKIYEDFLILTDIFLRAENVVFNGNAVYYYLIRSGSITHPETIKVSENIIEAASKTLIALKKEKKLKPDIVWGCLRRAKDMMHYCSKDISVKNNKDFIEKLRILYKNYYSYIVRSKLLTFKEKVSLFLFCYFLPFFILIVNRK